MKLAGALTFAILGPILWVYWRLDARIRFLEHRGALAKVRDARDIAAMATRLELLQRCVKVAADDIIKEKGLDGWTITTRSGERCLSIEFYHEASEDEWVCTFPTAGWGGTIEEIAERFRREVAPHK